MVCATDRTSRLNPWRYWRYGADPTGDALERISVLIRHQGEWDASYAYSLGAQARRVANHCPETVQIGLEMLLCEHGDLNAIAGWISEIGRPPWQFFDLSKNLNYPLFEGDSP